MSDLPAVPMLYIRMTEVPGAIVTERGLTLPPNMTFEEWSAFGLVLQAAYQRRQQEMKVLEWAIGDWIRFGERKWGEMYAQAIETTHLAYKTLANIAWTCGRIPPERRRPGLYFGHHAEVAALPAPQADALLEQAETEDWSVKHLRAQVQDTKDRNDGQDPAEARARRALAAARKAVEGLPSGCWADLILTCLLKPLGWSDLFLEDVIKGE